MRISDWSSDVCSSDLRIGDHRKQDAEQRAIADPARIIDDAHRFGMARLAVVRPLIFGGRGAAAMIARFDRNDTLHVRKYAFDAPEAAARKHRGGALGFDGGVGDGGGELDDDFGRSEEHTSELQYLIRIAYAVFGMKH